MNRETIKPLFEDASASSELRNFVSLARADGASQADLDRLATRLGPVLGISAALIASSAAVVGTAPVAAAAAFGAPTSGLMPALGAAAQGAAHGAKAGLLSQLLASTSAKLLAVGLSVGAAGVGVYSVQDAQRAAPAPQTSVARQGAMPSADAQRALSPAASPLPEGATSQQLAATQQAAALVDDTRAAEPTVPGRVFAPARKRAAAPARLAAAAAEPIAAPVVEPVLADEPVATTPPSPSVPPPSELSLIERAEAARMHQDQAFAFLAKHERLYPHGALAQEREMLAIELLLKAGRLSQAEARADRFEGAYPSSAHLLRLRALLARANAK